jgi:hypothetical protein
MSEFMVVYQQILCSDGKPFEHAYYPQKRFPSRGLAIAWGLKDRSSDDFNIAVIDDGKLSSFDWMTKEIEEDEDTMAEIARQIGVGI